MWNGSKWGRRWRCRRIGNRSAGAKHCVTIRVLSVANETRLFTLQRSSGFSSFARPLYRQFIFIPPLHSVTIWLLDVGMAENFSMKCPCHTWTSGEVDRSELLLCESQVVWHMADLCILNGKHVEFIADKCEREGWRWYSSIVMLCRIL